MTPLRSLFLPLDYSSCSGTWAEWAAEEDDDEGDDNDDDDSVAVISRAVSNENRDLVLRER